LTCQKSIVFAVFIIIDAIAATFSKANAAICASCESPAACAIASAKPNELNNNCWLISVLASANACCCSISNWSYSNCLSIAAWAASSFISCFFSLASFSCLNSRHLSLPTLENPHFQ